ncbi:hypothetical protein SteCoe_3476 [Stentor coeruleus]|uniref:Trichohyalin-plectin-homology domain-containing protein n=1 Tax=Stentor coeruleus TaxID=5963 RepID=A0A1R2CWW1_9CILI|nr:hypothetical protein SteCoe_3476 [Stentor coeruleus]
MANKRLLANQGEWAIVIKAQDEATNNIIKEEKELVAVTKRRYKEELDKQLQMKNKISKSQVSDKADDYLFHQLQQVALKDYENKKKLQDRNVQQFLYSKHQEDSSNKYLKQQQNTENDRVFEQQRIKIAQRELEEEKQKELSERYRRIQLEQEELRRIDYEKEKKRQMMYAEKLKDKEMIEKKMNEMKEAESSYREFYDRKLREQQKKISVFHPITEAQMYKQELIERRNNEYQKYAIEKEENRERYEEITKLKAIQEMKYELEKQIEDKQRKKLSEIENNKSYFEIAKSKAMEEIIQNDLERDKRNREREELKKVLKKQVEEKEQESFRILRMNDQEKRIHNNLLEDLKSKKPVAFPAVLGANLTESPRKVALNRIYGIPLSETPSFTVKETERQINNLTPDILNKSAESTSIKKKYYYPDPFKHNPITNPIGPEMPKYLPGQRILKDLPSFSTLARAGNSLLK